MGVEETQAKVPFYKREISFSRKKRPAKAEVARPSVPWYKREISFGGKKKQPAPAPAVLVEAPPAEAPPAPVAAAPVRPSVPWYKREISFGGKKKQPAPAPAVSVEAPPAEAPPAPLAAAPVRPSVPWYKREISFGGKKKQPALAPTVSPEVPTAPAAAVPAQASVPFYKREISFKRKPKPVAAALLPVAEAQPGAPVAADAEPAVEAPAPPAAPKVPFYKREISFGRGGGSPASPARGKSGAAAHYKALVGVKIGASGISAARVVQNGGRPELLELVREPLARGVVVAGEVRDVPALATALANLFALHRLPKKAVRLGVSNNRIGVRIIEVSGVMEPRQLENAIRFRAQEVLPIALEDAVLDFQQLSESVNAEGELVRRVLLVVAYRDLIDRYVIAFKEAGVRLVGIDLEAFGLLRALTPGSDGERADAAHVVVSIGHERSTFAVSDGRVCEFTRVLEWGGSTLDIAIARQLNLAPSEAEPVKHAIALDGSERPLPPDVTQEQVNLAADIVRRQLQTFARELVSSLQYYQNQPGSLGIGDIVITGGTSLLPGLAGELQRLIGVSVRVGDPFERVKVSRGVAASEDQRALAIAIGLAIEE